MSAEKPAEAPKKSKKKLVIILAAVLLLAAGGGGGGFWYMNQAKAGAHPEAAAKKPAKKPVFANLDPFTVNLQDERGERFAQIGVTLEVEDAAVELELKDHLPAVRNNILLLISSRRIEDLLTPEGKQKLAADIRGKAGQALGFEAPAAAPGASAAAGSKPNPVRNVLFSQFIVQ